MSITHKQLQGKGPLPGDSSSSSPKSTASPVKPKRAKSRTPESDPTSTPAADPRLLEELAQLRVRARALEEDAYSTTQILETARQEIEKQKKALAAAQATALTAAPQSAPEALERPQRDAALARAEAELSAEREARRQREDELVQKLRQSTTQLESTTQAVTRLNQEREAQRREREAQTAAKLWYLKLDDGSVIGPTEDSALHAWACQCRIGPDHELSRDKQTWVRARDVAALQMEWMVNLADGTAFGPLNVLAVAHLLGDGSVLPDSPLTNLRTGFACLARDAGGSELVTLHEAHKRAQAELEALRQKLEAERTRPILPPKSVRARVLQHTATRA